MNLSIKLDSPCELINVIPFNPLISKCQIKVCYVGEDPNRNRSVITKDTAREMANSLPGCPIVGFYNENTEDQRLACADKVSKIILMNAQPIQTPPPLNTWLYSLVGQPPTQLSSLTLESLGTLILNKDSQVSDSVRLGFLLLFSY